MTTLGVLRMSEKYLKKSTSRLLKICSEPTSPLIIRQNLQKVIECYCLFTLLDVIRQLPR